MDTQFKSWLVSDRGYSPRVVSNICSRLKRAESLTDSEAVKSSRQFVASVAVRPEWMQIPESSRSGILRSVHLYGEFLSKRK